MTTDPNGGNFVEEDFAEDVGLEGIFPNDGIEPSVDPGVPLGFDLVQLLSESMKSRDAWRDLARVTSRVLYEYFDKHRVALELSRDPENVARVIKIATLKMMGLDWRSNNLTDADYDRVVSTIAEYQENHGPEDFVRYIGFALGVPMELLTLWTTDYKTFVPGPDFNHRAIYQDPPGDWYPTSHVGLLYEEFAKNVDRVDEAELRDVFYKMAPIHLVLEFIASEVTLRVGPLYFALGMYETGEDSLTIGDRQITLLIEALPYERSEDTMFLFPDAPTRSLPLNVMVAGTLVCEDAQITIRPGIDWDPSIPLNDGGVVVASPDSPTMSRDVAGRMLLDTDRMLPWIGWDPDQVGALVNPVRKNFVPNSANPLMNTWLRSTTMSYGVTSYRGDSLYTLSTTNQGTIQTMGLAQGTNAVSWSLQRVSGCKCVAIARGSDRVVFDLTTNTAYPTAGVTSYGVQDFGSGFVNVWAVMTGKDVTLYPAWGDTSVGSNSAASTIAWFNFMVEDSIFPSAQIITPNRAPYAHNDTRYDTSFMDQFEYANGLFFMDAVPSFAEWTVADQTLFDLRNFAGDGISARLRSDGKTTFSIRVPKNAIDVVGGATATPLNPTRVGYRWDVVNGTLRLYNNWWSTDVAVPWLTNLRHGSLLHGYNVATTSQWTLRRVIASGCSDPSLLPSNATITWLFGT